MSDNPLEHKVKLTDDYVSCEICNVRAFFVSGDWFHEQHLTEEMRAIVRHPSNQKSNE